MATRIFCYIAIPRKDMVQNIVNSRGVRPDADTVIVEIFAKYIFSRTSHSVLGVRKYDVSEKLNHYSANRSNC